nr:DNA primase [Nostocaceae cyanobacterium]
NPIHKIDVDMPLVYDPIHLRIWAKFAARNNASLAMYRQSMRNALRAEGHQVKIVDNAVEQEKIVKLRQAFIASDREDLETRMNLVGEIISLQKEFIARSAKDKLIRQQIARIKRQEEISTAIKVAQATAINRREYEYLLAKRSLTETERNQVNKYILQQRYGVEVTSELKLQDDKGYYFQLLNHYYLTHESEYFHLRDRQEWNQQMFWGEGQVFLPDLKTYTLKVEAFRALGVLQFLEPLREFQETDPDLILLKSTALRYSKHIKRALGVGIIGEREKDRVAAIKVLSRVLTQFGLKLKLLKQKPDPDVVKTYTIDPKNLNDGRQTIFKLWHERDALILETAKITESNVSRIHTEPILLG